MLFPAWLIGFVGISADLHSAFGYCSVMNLNETRATSAKEMTKEGWFVAPVVMQRDTVYFASPDGMET